ncbi:hypothetical protein Mal64_32600 [Pseudobythopirellula maris]|uniref:Helix-turn-helix domain protein n=1 Tax=Pseudobythopirellula maris TaxID=2527991 RepID=A0A5C5ZL48_9BACT|nr:helix-turn-helix domain-containing protein [Pseudobythopirellula maris]TWT87717.1 hypothetical protein Mal64_32600 [Pseudobythopirellula maris]
MVPKIMKRPARSTEGPFAGSISIGRLARKWGVPRRHVRRLMQKGRLPFIEVAGKIRVPTDALRENTS